MKTNFVIDRKTWLRGIGDEDSRLKLPKCEAYCCLGQIALQVGAQKRDISNLFSPAWTKKVNWPLALQPTREEEDSYFTTRAMRINDNPWIADEDREKELIKLFADNGLKLKFTGSGEPAVVRRKRKEWED